MNSSRTLFDGSFIYATFLLLEYMNRIAAMPSTTKSSIPRFAVLSLGILLSSSWILSPSLSSLDVDSLRGGTVGGGVVDDAFTTVSYSSVPSSFSGVVHAWSPPPSVSSSSSSRIKSSSATSSASSSSFVTGTTRHLGGGRGRAPFSSSSSPPPPPFMTAMKSSKTDDTAITNNKLDWKKISEEIKMFWSMAYPYFEESKPGRWLFAGMIGLTLLNSGVSVVFSYLGKDFWNALSAKNTAEFYSVLSKYVGALLVGAPIVTLYKYQRERLSIHWREWMTSRTLQLYEYNRVYYVLEQLGRNDNASNDEENSSTADPSSSRREKSGSASSKTSVLLYHKVDNPDQRICEDVKAFTSFSLQLFLTLVTSIIDLVSFSFILYGIYPNLFIAIILYAAFGTVTTAWLGKDLVRLSTFFLRTAISLV